MQDLYNRSVGLEDVLGPAAGRLELQLYEAPTWEARFKVLDRVILTRIAAASPVAPEIAWAWSRLIDSGGRAQAVTVGLDGGRCWWLAGRSSRRSTFALRASTFATSWLRRTGRRTAFVVTESEGWAHFELTRINTTPTILPKKFEDLLQLRGVPGAMSVRGPR